LAYLYLARQEWSRVLDLCAEWQARLGYSPVELKAVAHARLGHSDDVARMAQETAALLQKEQSRQHQAEWWRTLALLRVAQGAVDEAASLLDQAIAGFEEAESLLDVGRAMLDRGALQRSLGNVQAAQADFTRAQSIFEQYGARRDADKARQALKSV
jgi:tetratricopeptide (TPR) repeat protein